MSLIGTRRDALRLSVGGVEIQHLHTIGTVPGVRLSFVSGANGPGIGYLRALGAMVAYKAPGSSHWGMAVACTVDGGEYMLEDGADPEAYVRVIVATQYLPVELTEGMVLLGDRFNNGVSSDDVSAAEAAAGDVETYDIDLHNQSAKWLRKIRFWFDVDQTAFDGLLAMSEDGIGWDWPTTEAGGKVFPDLVPGGDDVLHLGREVSAGADSLAKVLTHLHCRYYAAF